MIAGENKKIGGIGGFTLIELSVVMVIIGLLLAALLPLYNGYLEEKRIVQLEKTTNEIRRALVDFIIDDPKNDLDSEEARYPCPASPSARPGTASYGAEDCSLRTAAIGTCSNDICVRAGSDGGRVLVGAVPTRTLEIPSTHMLDPYNRRFTYAVSAALAAPNAMATLTTEGNVTIVDESGSTVTSLAQFALVSHGKNGLGAFTAEGSKTAGACSGTADSQNCAPDATFLAAHQSHGNNNSYYDDNVAFTLAAQNDDEWWQETDATGRHIINRNTHNVAIGIQVGDPTERLDVEGNIRARMDVKADQDVAAARNVNAGQNVTAARHVSAGQNVSAGQDVSAGNNITAGRDVSAGNNVTAGRDVAATNNVTAGNEMIAQSNIRSERSIFARDNFYGKHFFYSDVPSAGTSGTPQLTTAMCPEGQVLRGINAGAPVCVASGGSGGIPETFWVTNEVTTFRWPHVYVACPADSVVMSGGGECVSEGSVGWAFVVGSQPSGNGWHVYCDTEKKLNVTARVYAICMRTISGGTP